MWIRDIFNGWSSDSVMTWNAEEYCFEATDVNSKPLFSIEAAFMVTKVLDTPICAGTGTEYSRSSDLFLYHSAVNSKQMCIRDSIQLVLARCGSHSTEAKEES